MNRRGAHKSVQALKRDIRARNAGWNEDPKPFGWKKTTEETLDSLARYLQRPEDTTPSQLIERSSGAGRYASL
jgi:hypothetical protein